MSLVHLVEIDALSQETVHCLLKSASLCRELVKNSGGCDALKHRVLASAFWEPSTRTSSSFHAAMVRMGGSVIVVDESKSSSMKGESFGDTIRTLSSYGDAIVLRHSDKGSASRAAAISPVPVINAGDGTGEHPTQALLDLFTIQSELGSGPAGKHVCILGDLKHGRTAHSLAKLLAHFTGVQIYFCSPEGLEMPDDVLREVTAIGGENVKFNFITSMASVIPHVDVLYVTRVQKERFESKEIYNSFKSSYTVDSALLERAKMDMIVMHPLPRLDEISTDIDSDPRAAYFRQVLTADLASSFIPIQPQF